MYTFHCVIALVLMTKSIKCQTEIYIPDINENLSLDINEEKSIANLVFPHTHDFRDLIHVDAYVDKTLLIKEVIKKQRSILYVTAPKKFCKSSNLNTLRRFFEYEIQTNGKPQTQNDDRNEPIKDTVNYEIFNFKKTKIFLYKDLVNKYFGKFIIIDLDFMEEIMTCTYDGLLELIKGKIRRLYKKHEYLLKTNTLSDDDQFIFKSWFSYKMSLKFREDIILEGLPKLISYLYNYHQRDIYVLIDQHGQTLMNIIEGYKPENPLEYHIFVDFQRKLYENIFRNRTMVYGGFITGVSPIYDAGITSSIGIKNYRFLEDHEFNAFFGFVDSEATTLLATEKFKLDYTKCKKALALYDGYNSINGESLMNPFSIIKFLQHMTPRPYWHSLIHVPLPLSDILQIDAIRDKIKLLVLQEKIKFTIKPAYTLEDLLDLHKILEHPENEIKRQNLDVFFSYLLDLGLLSSVPLSVIKLKLFRRNYTPTRKCMMPNQEVKTFFKDSIIMYIRDYNDFNLVNFTKFSIEYAY